MKDDPLTKIIAIALWSMTGDDVSPEVRRVCQEILDAAGYVDPSLRAVEGRG